MNLRALRVVTNECEDQTLRARKRLYDCSRDTLQTDLDRASVAKNFIKAPLPNRELALLSACSSDGWT